MKLPGLRSLRSRFLLLVLGGVLVPLALTGLWLSNSIARSGESVLDTRLDAALDHVASDASTRWTALQAEMRHIARDSAVRSALLSSSPRRGRQASSAAVVVRSAADRNALRQALTSPVVLVGMNAETEWTVLDEGSPVVGRTRDVRESTLAGMELPIVVPVYGTDGRTTIGRVESRLSLWSLVPIGPDGAWGVDAVLQVIDRTTGAALVTLPFDEGLMHQNGFSLDGERWIVRRKAIDEPAVTIIAAAPLTAYTLPFKQAADKGTLAIINVAAITIGVATLLITRLTRSLEELVLATDAVAAGDLERRVSDRSDDEVSRVGRAFNAMTQSLRTTLRQLSQREALVAVGEFAASLAHEVRNPLTSMRIDLQRVDEKLPGDSPLRVQVGRALREVERLDHTVSGALRIARSGNIAADIVDLRVPLQRAIEVAMPSFEQGGAALEQVEIASAALPVRGDEAALEQLFLNILLNAAQALGRDGRAGVTASTRTGRAHVDIWDSGPGIAKDRLDMVFDPFYSTKKDGTGLGLSVARQIVLAHGGTIAIDSGANSGTTVSIRIPVAT